MRAEAGNGAVFMAGGIDLVNRMKFGEPVAEVIYLGGVAGLDAIAETEDALHLGSLVTHSTFWGNSSAPPYRFRRMARAVI